MDSHEMLKEAAREMLEAGYSVIPIRPDGSKAPPDKWGEFQKRQATPTQFENMFRSECGVAIVGGYNGLEILDFETTEVYGRFKEIADEEFPGLVDRLPRAYTPGGGVHVYLRSSIPERSLKLAMAAEPYTDSHGKKRTVLVESRGIGGYAVTAPSPGACHETGIPYRMAPGPTMKISAWCSNDERNGLFSICRSFNEVIEPEFEVGPGSNGRARDQGLPGDDYNIRGPSWDEILAGIGAKKVRSWGKIDHWRRPGKTKGSSSATVGAVGDKLYVFSSEWPPFEPGRAYSKFAAYTYLDHAGDFSAAARQLARDGYGSGGGPSLLLLDSAVSGAASAENGSDSSDSSDEKASPRASVFEPLVVEWGRWASGEVPKVVETPVPALNEQLGGGLEVGMVTTILGYTNIGKSEVVRQFRRHMAMAGHGVCHIDVELGGRHLIQREIAQATGIPSAYIRGKKLSSEEWARVEKAYAEFSSWSSRVAFHPLNGCVPLESLDLLIRQGLGGLSGVCGDGAERVVILDSLHKLAAGSAADSPRLQVTEFMHWCIRMARELQVVVLLVGEQKRSATGGRPGSSEGLTAGAESRSIEFDSHCLITLDAADKSQDDEMAPENSIASSDRRVRCKAEKTKEGTPGWCRQELVFEYPHWGFRVEDAEPSEVGRRGVRIKKDRDVRDAVLALMEGNMIMGVRAIQKKLDNFGFSGSRVQRVVQDLYNDGALIQTDDKKYCLADDLGVSE